MYVKLFNRILDSSIADNRQLRHFFTDMLLCADPDGNVVMTKKALANRIRATEEEVEWGLAELMKPDPESLTTEEEGRRVIPLEGHGYGWKIVNYAQYRDYRTSAELRKATAERVRKHREKAKTKQGVDGSDVNGELNQEGKVHSKGFKGYGGKKTGRGWKIPE